MNPTQSNPKDAEHHFPSFMVGLTVGIAAALLLGTDEGKQITRKIIDAIPDNLKRDPEAFEPVLPQPVQTVAPRFTDHHLF